MNISLSMLALESLVSRDGFFSSSVPRQPAHHLHTQAESGAYGIPPEFRGGVHLFFLTAIFHRVSPEFNRLAQLRIDVVHCRESARTGPVNLKVVLNECCLGSSPWTN